MENLNEMNQYLNTEIVCTVAGLGYAEGNEYYKHADCLESLKDLIKFLRRDDSTCEIRRQMGYSKILQNDLVAILKSCTPKETEIFNMVIRLMVNLTQPAVLCWEGQQVPEDKTGQHYHLELVNHLQAYKEAFTDMEVMGSIGKELAKLLQKDWESRDEEDYLLIERILLLIRNILHVPANPQAEKRTDDDASIHDQVIWSLHQNGIDDLLIYIGSSPDERRWCMHTLEVISLMLREQNPESLAKAGEERSENEKHHDNRQLERLRERELADKRKNALKFSGRHSRFGGTFTVKNMMSIADKREIIYHRNLADAKNMNFDLEKNARKKRKNQMQVQDMASERRSTLSIRMFLKEFCKQFLEHCYNPLLYVVRDNLMHERSQENDESYFLWAMKFFMEFTRNYDFRVDFVGETMSVSNFQYVLKIMMQYYESFSEDKQNPVVWGRRLHLAIQAYKELLMYVLYMDTSKDENLRENAKVIKANVFYAVEYRDIFMLLLRKFNKAKQSKSYLRDLVETFHVFLKMLEQFCQGKRHVIVQQKRKSKQKRKKSKKKNPRITLTAEQADEMWQNIASDLSAVVQGHGGEVPDSVVPFDAASDVTMDHQRVMALSKIQTYLQSGQYTDAVAFLRAAREVWPNDSFGSPDIEAEDEFMCLHNIFKMLDLPQDNPVAEEESVENEEELPEEEELEAVVTRETQFDFKDFLNKLANPGIVQPYCWLLLFYEENNPKTNHYIVKMLHRIAVDLKMYPMLFQLSLFMVFNKILNSPAKKQFQELFKFSSYIVNKFFSLLPKNPVLCAELVAWKNADACYEIVEGYGSLAFRDCSKPRTKTTFTHEEEIELRQLYERFQEEEDIVDKILENISDDTRTRRQIINKLVAMKLVDNRKTLRKKAEKKNSWPEEEKEQLRALYEEYKNCEDDVVGKILEHLTNTSRSRRQVVNQLVKMGVVEDRKSLRKKRKRQEKRKKKSQEVDEFEEEAWQQETNKSSDEEIDSGSSESDSEDDDSSMLLSLPTLVAKIKEKGLGEQIEWIQSKLKNTADDREDNDNCQPIPLVTITEENEEALGDNDFKAILKKIGLVPPANEQETFWRIPGNLNPVQLRKSAEDLNFSGQQVESASKKRKNMLAALAASRKESSTSAKKRRNRNRPEKTTGQSSSSKGKTWRMNLAQSSNDSSDSEDEIQDIPSVSTPDVNYVPEQSTRENESLESPKDKPKTTKKRKFHSLIDSDDSDTEESPKSLPSQKKESGDSFSKNNLDPEDSKGEDFIDRQDDDDDGPLVHHKKLRKVILVDDDDDDDDE
ncbi:protein timeless homolog [Exaiptasia diaphana]|uniref:Protein timeless homolog n=1 Tax=Exaiptasia diaphana TaxID=2652724 RepID=A0A913X455_EXADI|nr:protein timeless homolog [Exaiptasia diaphana]